MLSAESERTRARARKEEKGRSDHGSDKWIYGYMDGPSYGLRVPKYISDQALRPLSPLRPLQSAAAAISMLCSSLHASLLSCVVLLSSFFVYFSLPLASLAYFFIFFRFSGFRPYGPRPSSSFTSYRPDEATKPTTSPRCPFSFLALRLCSSTRVPMGMCAEGEGEAVGVADDDGADACC